MAHKRPQTAHRISQTISGRTMHGCRISPCSFCCILASLAISPFCTRLLGSSLPFGFACVPGLSASASCDLFAISADHLLHTFTAHADFVPVEHTVTQLACHACLLLDKPALGEASSLPRRLGSADLSLCCFLGDSSLSTADNIFISMASECLNEYQLSMS